MEYKKMLSRIKSLYLENANIIKYLKDLDSVCYKKLNSTKHKFFKNNYTPIHGVVKLR